MALDDPLIKLAQQCVKCGLCLPHCPTYQDTQLEHHSPRGRISLMEAYLKDELSETPAWQNCVDSCLNCRACESMCPADVSFHALWVGTKARRTQPLSYAVRALTWAIEHPQLMRSIRPFIRVAKHFRKDHPLLSKYPATPSLIPVPLYAKSSSPKRGAVTLLGDCLMPWTDTAPMHAAIKVLTLQGYDVRVLQPDTCCGGWFKHIGQDEKANTKLTALLRQEMNEPILTLSSACFAFLREEDRSSVEDLYTFLNSYWRPMPDLRVTEQTIGVHTPCTRKMPLNANGPYIDLLSRLPGVSILPILESSSCCGAGGQAQLTVPALSKRIGKKAFSKENLKDLSCIVTTNMSCQRQIQGLLGGKPIKQAIQFIADLIIKPEK